MTPHMLLFFLDNANVIVMQMIEEGRSYHGSRFAVFTELVSAAECFCLLPCEMLGVMFVCSGAPSHYCTEGDHHKS